MPHAVHRGCTVHSQPPAEQGQALVQYNDWSTLCLTLP
jgi:hypothetical protein